MKIFIPSVLSSAFILASSLHAELPILTSDEWFGYFTGTKNRKVLFGITRNTDSVFHILDNKGELLRASNPVKVNFRVLETNAPDNFTRKEIDVTSLSTTAEAGLNPKQPLTFSGTVTGKAAFESTVKIIPVGFSASGKITNPGELKSPLHFGIDIDFDPYKNMDLTDRKKLKELEKLARRDKLEIVTLSGEEKRYKIDDEVDFVTDFPNGVSSITFSCHRYEDIDYVLTASKSSAIHFLVNRKVPVHKAMKLLWKANEGANPAEESFTMIAD